MKLTKSIPDKDLIEITYQSLDIAANPVILLNKYGKLLWVNEAIIRSLGYSKNELEKMNIWDIDRTISKDTFVQLWSEPIEKRLPVFEVQSRHTKKNGEIIDVLVTVHIIEYNGEPLLFTYSQDITQRKKLEEKLVSSEEKYRALTETSNDAIFIINKDMKISFVNRAGASYLMDTPENLLGRSIESILPADEKEYYKNTILQVIKKDKPEEFDINYKLPDGQRWFNVRIIPLKRADSEDNFLFIYASDINSRKVTEYALHTANKKLNMLTSIVRHDILNYLMASVSYIQLMQMELEDKKMLDYLEKMNESARSIEKLITFTREYQSLGVEVPKWQKVGEIVEELKNEPIFRGLKITDSSEPVEIFADALFHRVFFNLFENSVRHGVDVTRIEISSHKRDGQLVIVVEDDGIGIETEDKEKIFNEHFGKHTGLGLFLIREILSITGLKISENGTPGKGARFEILVPEGDWRKQ